MSDEEANAGTTTGFEQLRKIRKVLPSTGGIVSEGKYKCNNPKCLKCYPKPKQHKRFRCKIGIHDFHLNIL